jgi:hypothetical protein
MPKRSLHLVVAVGLLLAGRAALAQELEEKGTTFGTASLRLPKGWEIKKAASEEGFTAKAPKADKDAGSSEPAGAGGFSASVSVQVKGVSGEVDVPAMLKNWEGSLAKYRRVEEPTAVALGEAKGMTFGGTFVTMGMPVRTRVYVVTMEGKLYVIGFSTLASKWGDYQGVIEACVKTFAVGRKN